MYGATDLKLVLWLFAAQCRLDVLILALLLVQDRRLELHGLAPIPGPGAQAGCVLLKLVVQQVVEGPPRRPVGVVGGLRRLAAQVLLALVLIGELPILGHWIGRVPVKRVVRHGFLPRSQGLLRGTGIQRGRRRWGAC